MKSLPFLKGLSWLLVLNILVKPAWIFFIDRQVQNLVGNEVYGKYFALLSLSYLFYFLSDAGLSNMLNQRLAQGIAVNTRQFIRIKMVLLLIYVLACSFAGYLVHITQWEIFLYIIGSQLLGSLFVFLRSIITANQFFTADAWFSVVDKVFMILLCGSMIYFTWFGQISLLIYLQVQCISTALAVIAALFFIWRKGLVTLAPRENIDFLIRATLPFAVCVLLMALHYRLDGFLLERLRGAHEAGIYALGYRLLDAGNMAGYLAASFLVPFIARHRKEGPVLEEAVLNTRHFFLFLAIGALSFTWCFSSWLSQVLYHTNDQRTAWVLALCMASLPGYYLVHLYGSMLTATKNFRAFIGILLLSVFLNLVLNLLFIPARGAIGSAMAAIISQYVCGIACVVAATREFRIAYGWKSILVYLFSAALLGSFFYFARMAWSNVWMILLIAAAISLLLLATQLSFVKKYFLSIR